MADHADQVVLITQRIIPHLHLYQRTTHAMHAERSKLDAATSAAALSSRSANPHPKSVDAFDTMFRSI